MNLTEADYDAIDEAVARDTALPSEPPVVIYSEFRKRYSGGLLSFEDYDELFYYAIWADGKRREFDTWSASPERWQHLHRGFEQHDPDRLLKAVADAGKRADAAIAKCGEPLAAGKAA